MPPFSRAKIIWLTQFHRIAKPKNNGVLSDYKTIPSWLQTRCRMWKRFIWLQMFLLGAFGTTEKQDIMGEVCAVPCFVPYLNVPVLGWQKRRIAHICLQNITPEWQTTGQRGNFCRASVWAAIYDKHLKQELERRMRVWGDIIHTLTSQCRRVTKIIWSFSTHLT